MRLTRVLFPILCAAAIAGCQQAATPVPPAAFARGLAEAGKTAYKAAKSRNLDAMVDVSGAVSDACAACHEKYRDVPEGKERCI